MLQGESGAAQWEGGGGAQREVGRHAMKVVEVVREARLAGSKTDRVWKGDKWVKQERGEYTRHKNVQSALKSNSLSLKTNEKVPVG